MFWLCFVPFNSCLFGFAFFRWEDKNSSLFFSVPPAKLLAAEKKRFFLPDENMVNIFFYSDENMEPYTFGILFAHPLAPAGADAVLPADRKVQQDARRRASAPRP